MQNLIQQTKQFISSEHLKSRADNPQVVLTKIWKYKRHMWAHHKLICATLAQLIVLLLQRHTSLLSWVQLHNTPCLC